MKTVKSLIDPFASVEPKLDLKPKGVPDAMSKKKPLPCPFCASVNTSMNSYDDRWECDDCNAKGPDAASDSDGALALWNDRQYKPGDPDKPVEKLPPAPPMVVDFDAPQLTPHLLNFVGMKYQAGIVPVTSDAKPVIVAAEPMTYGGSQVWGLRLRIGYDGWHVWLYPSESDCLALMLKQIGDLSRASQEQEDGQGASLDALIDKAKKQATANPA